MRAELITDLAAVPGVEDEWRRLAASRGNAFISPDWYRAWVRPGGSQSPLVVAVRDASGELAGVLPLVLDATRPRAIRFAGSSFGDRFGVASRPEVEADVATTAMAALQSVPGGRRMLVLQRVDADGGWPDAMRRASRRPMVLVEQSRAQLPHISVAGLDWEGYLAGRSQKFRQRVARGLERNLDKKGIAFTVRETAEIGAVNADMELLFRLHDLRHSADDSSITSPDVRASLTSFARAAMEQGWLRLRVLEIEGEPAAAYLAWRLGASYAVYQSGFDPAFAEHGAGMLLLNDTVRSAIAEDAGEVDLLLGGEPFKWRFAPDPREVRTVALVGARSPAQLLVLGEAAARRRARGLASRPRIGRTLRRIAALLPGER